MLTPHYSVLSGTHTKEGVFLDTLVTEPASLKQFVNMKTSFKCNLEAKSYTTALQNIFAFGLLD